MKNNNPIYPYKSLFITGLPGIGTTTLAMNIVKKFLDSGKKCLIFQNTDCFFTDYIERIKCIEENADMNFDKPCFQKHGNLVVSQHYLFNLECVMMAVDEYKADVIVYEEPNSFWNKRKELKKLAKELEKQGKIFIFVTHIKRGKYLKKSKLSNSRHHTAIRHFDAAVMIYRMYLEEDVEELRIYEKKTKKRFTVPVHFDFPKQRITLK